MVGRTILFTTSCLLLSGNGKHIADLELKRHGIIIVRFGRKGDVIYFRVNSTEVDLYDLRAGNKIPGVTGRGGTLHLRLTKTNRRPLFSWLESVSFPVENSERDFEAHQNDVGEYGCEIGA